MKYEVRHLKGEQKPILVSIYWIGHNTCADKSS